MVSFPAGKAELVRTALPEESRGVDSRTLEPREKVRKPVGVPPMPTVLLTVAVSETV